jgi:nucleoside-diphosphate-sugar epimerase
VLRLGPGLGVEVCAGRINAVFGPWERDTGLRDTLSPHLQMIAMANEGRQAVLAEGADRDWIYAPDVAQAFVRMLEAPSLPATAMNITQGRLWPLAIMAEALADRFPTFKWRYGETNLGYGGPIDRPRRALSGKKIQELLGWSPAFSPETACSDFARRL